MKILHVVPTYFPAVRYGGPIYSVHGLCRALAARGHEVHVFTTNVDGPNNLDVPLSQPVERDGVRVSYFPSRLRRLYWSPQLGRAIEAFMPGCDVVHLHSLFLWPTWATARVAQRQGIPYGISPRGMLVQDLIRRKNRLSKSVWISLIERKNIEHASFLHVTSDIEAQEARRFGFHLPEVAVIPNGVGGKFPSEEAPSRKPDIAVAAPFILFVGRINWKKGLDRLIPAMAALPGVDLIVVGNDEENYLPTLQKIAAKTRVTGQVRFVGPVHGSAKIWLLRRAALLVLPSYSENFGNVVIEAMAEGCPVAVTPEVGLAETVRETGTGIVLPEDSAAMGAALRELLENTNRRQAMGERGTQLAKKYFTWEKVAERMEQVYEQVMTRKQHNRTETQP